MPLDSRIPPPLPTPSFVGGPPTIPAPASIEKPWSASRRARIEAAAVAAVEADTATEQAHKLDELKAILAESDTEPPPAIGPGEVVVTDVFLSRLVRMTKAYEALEHIHLARSDRDAIREGEAILAAHPEQPHNTDEEQA